MQQPGSSHSVSRPTTTNLAVLLGAVALSGLAWASTAVAAPKYQWPGATGDALVDRFDAPAGFKRVSLKPKSFGAWLRTLPLAPEATPVLAFDGRIIDADAAAVIAIDVGSRDLQQCADSILRLRAEYLFAAGRTKEIAFRYTSGDVSAFSKWARGYRPKVTRRSVTFSKRAKPDASHASFRRYLTDLFIFAGTASLERFTPKPNASGATFAASDVKPGMFFVRGGFPGHAILVLDVIEDGAGHRRLLLGQGYMPAQSFHVVEGKNGPWFPLDDGATSVAVPTWPSPFPLSSLREF